MIKEQHKHSGKERGSNWGVANVETSQITFLRNSSSRFQRECHNWKFTKKSQGAMAYHNKQDTE